MVKITPRMPAAKNKEQPDLIEIPKISGTAFKELRESLGVTKVQLTMLTDISRQRLARIERDDPTALNSVEGETPHVPRALVLALMAVKDGMLNRVDPTAL